MPPTQRIDDQRLTDAEAELATDAGPPRHVGKGGAAPERRCIATMASRPQAEMIRFVLSPDGVVTPDLAARLPGRGAWVTADRASLETAIRKGAFSRAFRMQAKTPPELADDVERLLARRLLDGLGLAKRAGEVVTGFDNVRQLLREQRPACMIEASDGSADGRSKVLGLSRAAHGPERPDLDGDIDDEIASLQAGGDAGGDAAGAVEPPVLGCFSSEELAMALGRERVIHACLKQGRLAQGWMGDLARLSGFRRVTPVEWRPAHGPDGQRPDDGRPSARSAEGGPGEVSNPVLPGSGLPGSGLSGSDAGAGHGVGQRVEPGPTETSDPGLTD